MTLAEVRKTAAAVLGGIASVIPQVLATGAGIIPEGWAFVLTTIGLFATAVAVYLLPNAPADPKAKAEKVLAQLEPLLPAFQEMLYKRVSPQTGAVLQRIDDVLDDYPFKR